MKTLFRIFLVLLVMLLIVAGAAYFVVTRPAFQKNLVESNLPPGSSINSVRITTGSIELTDLKLLLADGTTAKLDSLRSKFSPRAALLDNTLKLRGLQVDGLLVKLPEATGPTAAGGVSSVGETPEKDAAQYEAQKVARGKAGSPADAIYELGEIEWLLDIDSININGALIDASRNRYSFDVNSNPIAPGEESTLQAALKLESKEALQGGLKDFSSDLRLSFLQKQNGGFEQLRVESQTSGTDSDGAALLSISQTLDLSINGFEKSAEFALSFDADLPRPAVFAPELAELGGLSLQGELKASLEGSALILQTADLDVASDGAQVVSVQLMERLSLGAEQKFSGELMEVRLVNLPLAWLNPWLSNGMQFSGAPVSAQIALSGEESGALEVRTLAPLQIGTFSLSQNGEPLLQEVTLRMNPMVRVEADQTFRYDLGDFELLDRYGAVISGTVSGSRAVPGGASPLSGLRTKASLDLGLAELFQQPALAGMASVMAGQARIVLDVDGSAEYPAQLQAAVTGLRARDMPGSRQDFRFSAQLKETGGGYALSSKLAAGSESRPSTDIRVDGQVFPEDQPLSFKVDLAAPRIRQSDLDLLMAAFQSNESAVSPSVSETSGPSQYSPPTRSAPYGGESGRARPPWADLDGEVLVKIDEFRLESGELLTDLRAQATITEALLAVKDIAASLQGGGLSGNAEVVYNPSLDKAYQISSMLKFKDLDPSIFSQKRSGSFPVRGLFDGNLNLSASGVTLEQALEDSEGDLLITGRDGVLTAFELDNRSQLGLLGAGILGQQLNRPGITALAQAVPYFKDMRFEDFTLKLVRGQDKKVRIPELKFIGDNLLINGQGFVAASSLGEVLDQPLELTLGLGAKGRLIDYLSTLQLLGPDTSEDGFRRWNKEIKIGGTLGDPDTDALTDMLNAAARRALERPKDRASATSSEAGDQVTGQNSAGEKGQTPVEPEKKTKEERRRDDIEMGLDLLNSVFGQ